MNIILQGWIVAIIAGVFLLHQTSFAQTFDPSMLEALKKQSQSGAGNTRVVSPLDEAREQQKIDNQQLIIDNQQLILEQDQKELPKPSRLELDFRGRLNSEISQYGYSVFMNNISNKNVMTGAISDNYKLGIGDQLIITFQGSKSEAYTVKVDLEGRVIIPDLKPISVMGMSYGNFKSILKKQVSESIIGTEVYVSLASVRSISVFVVGEVKNPGVVHSTSLATPLEILMNAGGVKKTGSLRHITIYHNGKKSIFDIYDLLNGTTGRLETLNDGDRIIVPTIGATIALDGEMVRPGIYELPANSDSISFKEAMQLAGGTLRPSGYELSQVTLDNKGKQNFRTMSNTDKLHNGEALIAHLVENSQSGKVELVGHVKTPGFRSLSSAENIRDLLGGVLNLEDDPYLLFGLIERVDKKTQTRLLQPFNPEKVFSGEQNIQLKDRDRVIFLGRSDITFLISPEVREVIFSGDSGLAKTCTPLKSLARIINDTQSGRFATATRAVFVRKEISQKKESESEPEKNEKLRGMALSEKQLTQLTLEEKKKKEEKEKLEIQGNCPAVYRDVNNLLPFILEYIVSIDGAVRLPGVYPVTEGTSIASLLTVSGGTSQDANMTNIEITSIDTNSPAHAIEMKWDYIDENQTDLSTISINPGGGIRVGSKYSNFENGAVLLSGEFKQPGVYTVRKGEKLSDLILRAGGVTDQAYTYGAIFTRKSVKEIQRIELQNTAKHLQSAMISASVKKNMQADSLMSAQQLTDKLANAELIGRVVIEADPIKLSLDPSLDTVLEAGDTLYMPKRPNFIIAMGDVLNPGALQFIPGKGIGEYIKEVGSYSNSADESRVYIVYPNGVAQPISLSSWGGDRNLSIPPGTAIVVPTDLSPYDSLSLVKEIGGVFQNLAVSAASIAVLIR